MREEEVELLSHLLCAIGIVRPAVPICAYIIFSYPICAYIYYIFQTMECRCLVWFCLSKFSNMSTSKGQEFLWSLVSKLWSFVLFPNYYIRYFPNYGVSMSLFPNYGPLPCSFDWVQQPNRTFTFSTNLIRAYSLILCHLLCAIWWWVMGFLWWWVFDCDFFDFWFRTHGMSIHELMGISLISWGRIFLGREPILINSIFLKPFELMDLYLRLVNIWKLSRVTIIY